MAEADAATRSYLTVIDHIVRSDIGRNISLKLTQLGLTVDRATCVDNLRRRLDAAERTPSSCGWTWRTRRTRT